MQNTITSKSTTVTTKPVADSAYELVCVGERLAFWSIAFAAGYIGYYVAFKTIFDLVGMFFTTV